MSFTIQSAQSIFPGTLVADVVPTVVESFSKLNAEDQLALLWFAYTERVEVSQLRLLEQQT